MKKFLLVLILLVFPFLSCADILGSEASSEPTISKYIGMESGGALYDDFPLPEEEIMTAEELEDALYRLGMRVEILEASLDELEKHVYGGERSFATALSPEFGSLEDRIRSLEERLDIKAYSKPSSDFRPEP